MRQVSAVTRAIDIVSLICLSPDPVRVPLVAEQLGLPRASVYELVNTLVHRGVLRQSPEGLLSPGAWLLEIGAAAAQKVDLVREAQEIAEVIGDRCDETVQVAVLDGREIITIVKRDSTHAVRMVSAVGRRLPAHTTGVGKAMLSTMNQDEILSLYRDVDQLEVLTPSTIRTLPDLLSDLAQVRTRGYAFDDCESNLDVQCVAVPVVDASGATVAALSISVPTLRMSNARRKELARLAGEGAHRLSARLGYSGEPPDSAPKARRPSSAS